MFNLGFTELILLGIIALVFIGPNQLPEVARTVGRLLNELKRATSDFQTTFTTNITSEVQDRWNEHRQGDQPVDPAQVTHHEPHEDHHHHHDPHHIGPPTDHDVASAAVQQEDNESLPIGVHPVSEDDKRKV